jgi:hypothetical protein
VNLFLVTLRATFTVAYRDLDYLWPLVQSFALETPAHRLIGSSSSSNGQNRNAKHSSNAGGSNGSSGNGFFTAYCSVQDVTKQLQQTVFGVLDAVALQSAVQTGHVAVTSHMNQLGGPLERAVSTCNPSLYSMTALLIAALLIADNSVVYDLQLPLLLPACRLSVYKAEAIANTRQACMHRGACAAIAHIKLSNARLLCIAGTARHCW